MAATMCALQLPVRIPVEVVASCTGRSAPQQRGGEMLTSVGRRFPRSGGMTISPRGKEGRDSREGRLHNILLCRAEGGGGEGKSCCGGGEDGNGSSSSSSGGGKCSSHGKSEPDVDVSGIGKEFETLVATKTMQEFESQYESGQMEGNISRDVMADVVNIYPDAASNKSEEKFLDVDELLAEARALSSSDGDFIFDADFENMLV